MNKDHLHISFSGLGRARPRLVTLDARSDRMPSGLVGARALFVADVHMSRFYPERAVLRLLEQIEALSPDLILWGGDYAESRRYLRRFFALVARLRPPMGMFAVPGNNDLQRMSEAELGALMKSSGVTLLVNERVRLPVTGGNLSIFGLDDRKYGHPEPRILELPCEAGEVRVLLAHSPSALNRLPESLPNPPDLILCGHTHGGQWSLFGFNPYSLGYEWARRKTYFRVTGAHRIGPSTLVVSNGVGTSLFPLRIGAPPELHLITFS